MTERLGAHHVSYENGWYRVYRVVNGKYRLYLGPRFDKPKDAALYAQRLDETAETSPLRDGHDANTGVHHSVGDVSIPDQSGQ